MAERPQTNLGRVLPVDRGNYDSEVKYAFLDMVRTTYSTFLSKVDENIGNDPARDEHEKYWVCIADGRPAADAAEAASQQTAADHAQYVTDHNQAVSDHTRAGNDHSTAAADHTTAESDHTLAQSDHTTAAADHTLAQSDHSTAVADHTQAGTDHNTAVTDHSTAVSDHNTADTDHTVATDDHTIAVTDHNQAVADHAQFENFTSGTYPNLTAGDITPDVDELIDATNLFAIQSTGGDADVQTGDAEFVEVRGYLDENLNPFLADSFVSTDMNLVDDTQYLTIDGKKAYYFPVVKGEWGEYGTSNKNNGYIILGETPLAVYFSESKPTASSYGEACPNHVDHSTTYYLPDNDGWLIIKMDDDTVPACHIVWNNEMDADPGEFDNQVKNISTIVQAIHAWGMAALIGPERSIFDRFSLRDKKTYSSIDRSILTDLTFTMTEETSEDLTTTYVFTATKPSAMKLGGLYKTNYDDLIVDEATGNFVVRSTTITSLQELAAALAGKVIYWERTTEVTTNIDAAVAAALQANTINNFGLSYFLYSGELVTVPAYVTEAFHQTGKGQLFDGLARQALVEEIVAECLCSIDKRVDGIDQALREDIYKYVIDSLTKGKYPNYRALNDFVTVFERRGSASPITDGVVPRFIGDVFRDTTNKIRYEAFGYTASDWVAMNS